MADAHVVQRPARGLPPEEALERWSDPKTYAAMREYWEDRQGVSVAEGVKPPPKVLRHMEYRKRRDPLEEAFHSLLEEGKLLATAVRKDADPTATRMIVDPEVFSDASINWEQDDIRGHSRAYKLQLVEIFEPPGVPRNVRVIPDWYWESYEPARSSARSVGEAPAAPPAQSVETPGFSHHADYRHVRLNGVDFALTRTQALIVKQLHEAFLEGEPWRYGAELLNAAGSSSLKMFQIFRRMKNWSELIESDSRGFYRLNVRE